VQALAVQEGKLEVFRRPRQRAEQELNGGGNGSRGGARVLTRGELRRPLKAVVSWGRGNQVVYRSRGMAQGRCEERRPMAA
jgi:hypothetical protein